MLFINVENSGLGAILWEEDSKFLGQTYFDMHLRHPSEFMHWEVGYEGKVQETALRGFMCISRLHVITDVFLKKMTEEGMIERNCVIRGKYGEAGSQPS